MRSDRAGAGIGKEPESAAGVRRWRRTAAVQLGLLLGALAVIVRLIGGASSGALTREVLASDELRELAVARLVRDGQGLWDAFGDPEVGRVLQPGLRDRMHAGVPIASNAYGLREREFLLPHDGDAVRVVLLGDSYVFGFGIPLEERIGAFLERELGARARNEESVEVLHVGIDSWNLRNECAYARRQLRALAPDLVVQIVVTNDLDDASGVRGFGAKSTLDPSRPGRAGGRVRWMSTAAPASPPRETPLLLALDHESRTRYAEASREIGRLAAAVEASGARYLLLGMWTRHLPMVESHLASGLRPDQWGLIGERFARDRSTWTGGGDRHWNARGCARVAELIYGLAVERELLPQLALEPWDRAAEAVQELHRDGVRTARGPWDPVERLAVLDLRGRLCFDSIDEITASHVYGGIADGGLVAPYASVVLRQRGEAKLVVRGEPLAASSMGGARARVFLEELAAAEIALDSGGPFRVEVPIPEEMRQRPLLNVRFVSDDYVYRNPTGGCASFRLRELTLE